MSEAEQAADVEAMTALITGYAFAALQGLNDVLTAPIEWHECDPSGVIAFKLASGMYVVIGINVAP